MTPAAHLRALLGDLRTRATRAVLRHRVRARHPTLHCDPTVVWDYAYDDLDALEIGAHVAINAFCELVVFRRSPHSTREGRLVLEDHAILGAGVNVRAAGGCIRIGRHSGIGQHSTVVAANHQVRRDLLYLRAPWDESRTGVDVGANVWVSANCVLLPGARIGDGAVVAAGSVVTGEVPPGEIWGGIPARRLKAVPDGEALAPAAHVSAGPVTAGAR